VNGIVERAGRLRRPTEYRKVIEKIVSAVGRRVDESSPMVDARLPDGSRVNAIVPPLAVHGPCLTIRRFSEEPFTAQDLIGFGSLSDDLALVLEACVRGKLNILVSGGTATGKTTILNVLSRSSPSTSASSRSRTPPSCSCSSPTS
jgi:pilus assembly protein CpaF